MTQITKSEAVVLKKTNYSDSSLILQLFTKEFGKISAIVKGARSPKSKVGSKIDVLNHIEVVFYKREEKDLQLITQSNLISHFPKIKEELDKLKYSSAISELLLRLTPEDEVHEKLFRGVIKIFQRINDTEMDSQLLFSQFLLFFIKEIGFEISLEKCSHCGLDLELSAKNAFNYADGFICNDCNEGKISNFEINEELFNLLKCLTLKNKDIMYNKNQLNNIIFILEKFLMYHNQDFKGLKSLQIF